MNTCPTVKEIEMPGCYSGVLKVSLGLEPGTELRWSIINESMPGRLNSTAIVDADGNITIDSPGSIRLEAYVNYFNTYKLQLTDSNLLAITIKGYDCYRLLPVKNANEVIDVII